MTRGQTHLLAGSLVALTALLVGFQSVSTLLTVTQLGASPTDRIAAEVARVAGAATAGRNRSSQASQRLAAPAPRASESAARWNRTAPAAGMIGGCETDRQAVPDNQAGVAAAAKAKAQSRDGYDG